MQKVKGEIRNAVPIQQLACFRCRSSLPSTGLFFIFWAAKANKLKAKKRACICFMPETGYHIPWPGADVCLQYRALLDLYQKWMHFLNQCTFIRPTHEMLKEMCEHAEMLLKEENILDELNTFCIWNGPAAEAVCQVWDEPPREHFVR